MIVALVPVNALAAAKSRLSAALSPAERVQLTQDLLTGVLQALQGVAAITATAVVSPDPRPLALAAALGATGLLQDGSGLNAGLEQGRAWALAAGAGTLLVLLGDLPLLRAADIQALIDLSGHAPTGGPVVVLAPDRHEQGTNALLLCPPGAIPFRFGRDSFAQHRKVAGERQIAARVYRAPGTAFDLDTPGDLAALEAWLPRPTPAGRPRFAP